MYGIIETPEKKHIHFFRIFYVLFSILIIVFLLYVLFMYVYNNSKITNTTPQTMHFAENFSLTSCKNTFNIKKNELLQIKKGDLLTEEQYNKIINIYSNQTKKTVFLTFDDGPSKNVTPLILDLLKQENIKATFFVLGSNVERYPEILQREYYEGHFIASHGYSHRYSEIYQSVDTILNDYKLCENAVRLALNMPNFSCRVYRFPGGSVGGKYHDIKHNSKELLKQEHIAYLDWNALTRDAEGTPTRESIIESLESTVNDKDVVVLLMHDSSSKILTYDTLPNVISFFKEKGYTFKCLYDVL